jgi:hypothetical protein
MNKDEVPKYEKPISRKMFCQIFTGMLLSGNIFSACQPNNSVTKMKSISFIEKLVGCQHFDGKETTDKIAQKSNSIDGLIFGENHGISQQYTTALQIIQSIDPNNRLVYFFYETSNKGLFSSFFESNPGIIKEGNSIIKAFGMNYVPLDIELTELKKRVKKSKDELIITYTGNAHADSFYRSFPDSIFPKEQAEGGIFYNIPTADLIFKKQNKNFLSIIMMEIERLVDGAVVGFLRLNPYLHSDMAEEFKLNLTEKYNKLKADRFYQLDENRMVLLTNNNLIQIQDITQTGLGFNNIMGLIDYHSRITDSFSNILHSAKFEYGVNCGQGSRHIRILNSGGNTVDAYLQYSNGRKSIEFLVVDNKITRLN